MHVVIERAELTDIATAAAAIVETKKTVPILSHMLLTAADGTLSATASDLEIDVSTSAPAQVEKPGRIAIPAQLLLDIARRASGAEIEMRLNPSNGTVAISSAKAKFALPTLPAEDFPTTHAIGVVRHSFQIDVQRFMDLLRSTRYAMSTELSRHYLRGVYLHGHDAKLLRAVSTNGHILSRRDVPAPAGSGGLEGVILPAKLVAALPKIADGVGDEAMTVSLGGASVQFAFQHLTLTSRLVDGTFPDYQRIVPQTHTTQIVADAEALAGAVARVGAIAPNGIGLHVNGALTIKGRGRDGGTAEDAIDVAHTGPDVSIGFNAQYIIDTLAHIEGDSIWQFGDAGTPAVVRSAADDSMMFILMPMRL